MKLDTTTPFYQLLDTKYDEDREEEAIAILTAHPELAKESWPGPDEQGKPFIKGSTALHYAANDGKVQLMQLLIDYGADVNAANANWYATPLSWAANNAELEAIRLLITNGADPNGPNVLHAAAYGGSSCGAEEPEQYIAAVQLLIVKGADINSRKYYQNQTPLTVAIGSGNRWVADYLRSIGAKEK